METELGAIWYRYDDSPDSFGVSVDLTKYEVIKLTPKGAWLVLYGWSAVSERRLVLYDSLKKFAYPTAAQALDGFIARKKRQVQILSKQYDRAQEALRIAKDIKSAQNRSNLRYTPI